MLKRIRVKLMGFMFLLVAVVTVASSAVVMGVMDRLVLEELFKKGLSIGRSASASAGFNLLSDDVLELDNLAAKLKDLYGDLLFVAAVDNQGLVRAHSELGKTGDSFAPAEGIVMRNGEDGSLVTRAWRDGVQAYEFRVPIVFTEKKLGDVYLAIDSASLAQAKAETRKKLLPVAAVVLLLGFAGAFYLSSRFTTPIKYLSRGVSELASGEYDGPIPLKSDDELGELTRNFNDMAGTITLQKRRLLKSSRKLEEAYISTVRLLATALDARDDYTHGHSARVAELSVMLGRKLGLGDEELRDLEIACLFHDVGKISTPDYILNKDAPLTEEENRLMMKHTRAGAEILQAVDSLHRYIPAALYHHERYDGSGYPEGLKGDEIPLFAAIISIVDAYDAMTSSRPYRFALSRDVALDEIRRCSGEQFHPRMVGHFIEVLAEYETPRMKTFLSAGT
jgi:putative nucleotidyltransferase with HDIG domain